MFFFISFSSLIFLHHYNFLYQEKQRLLGMSLMIKKDSGFLNTVFERKCKGKCEMIKDVTRDFLVIEGNKIIFKRGIYDFMDLDDFLGNKLDYDKVYKFDLEGERVFYVIKTIFSGYDIYFTRDISFHSDYEESLIFIFLFLSIFLAIFIYIFSYKLAAFTLEPLRKYNESLKLYNHHIAHELKTPLSVLKSDLELLKISYDKDTLNSSLEEIDNMKTVIDSMLFLSENVVLGNQKDFDLVELINELSDFYSKKSNNGIIIKGKKFKELILKGDKNLVRTMLKNLFENSIKYSSDGKIFIEFFKDSLEISNKFSYEIKENDINKLFEAFYKLNYDSNSFGLGLSIVKKIIELHGFKISLEVKDNFFNVKINF